LGPLPFSLGTSEAPRSLAVSSLAQPQLRRRNRRGGEEKKKKSTRGDTQILHGMREENKSGDKRRKTGENRAQVHQRGC